MKLLKKVKNFNFLSKTIIVVFVFLAFSVFYFSVSSSISSILNINKAYATSHEGGSPATGTSTAGTPVPVPGINPTITTGTSADASQTPGAQGQTAPTNSQLPHVEKTPLYGKLNNCVDWSGVHFIGCVQVLVYFLFVTLPSALAGLTAWLFNFMLAKSFDPKMYEYPYITNMWRIIRDLGNILFIFALLYAAFQIILDIGHGHGVGGGGKSMVAHVIIIALLVNFSLFFTKIIIDAGNTLGLIFYNKIGVEKSAGGEETTYIGFGKDIGGAIMSGFNPQNFFTEDFVNDASKETTALLLAQAKAKEIHAEFRMPYARVRDLARRGSMLDPDAPNTGCGTIFTNYKLINNVPILENICIYANNDADYNRIETDIKNALGKMEKPQLDSSYALIAAMVAYGAVMWVLFYVFFVAAWAFLGRTMELIMLMIVSPIAFMTYAVPFLKTESLQFDKWVHRVVSASFMAPVFMIILYLVSQMMNADIFGSTTSNPRGFFERLISMFVPAFIVIYFLIKGTKYAKEASGVFGEAAFKIGGMVGGMFMGGAAMTGRAIIGGAAAKYATGDSRVAKTAVGRFMQNAPILRGLRQIGRIWTKKPDIGREETIGGEETKQRSAGSIIQTGALRGTPTPGEGQSKAGITTKEGKEKKEEVDSTPHIIQAGEEKGGVQPVLLNQFGRPISSEEQRRTDELKEEKQKEAEEEKPKEAPPESAKTIKDKVASGEFFARQKAKGAKWLAAQSFDFRNSKVNDFLKEQGIGMDFGKGGGKGGYTKEREEEDKKKKELLKWLMPSAEELAALNLLNKDLNYLTQTIGSLEKEQNRELKEIKDLLAKEKNADKQAELKQRETERKNYYENQLASLNDKKAKIGEESLREAARIKKIRDDRLNNFANVVDRGHGIDRMASYFGLYNPNNLATGAYIREHKEEFTHPSDSEAKLKKIMEEFGLEVHKHEDHGAGHGGSSGGNAHPTQNQPASNTGGSPPKH